MDPKQENVLSRIKNVFESERLSVLSTQKDGQPYASLVAFAVTRDLKQMLFLTPVTTRKFDNLTASPKVAMLVNNSRNQAEDITNAVSITATGRAVALRGDDKKQFLDIYLERHPHLKDFAKAPTTALVSVAIDMYIMVSRFQNVVEIRMGS